MIIYIYKSLFIALFAFIGYHHPPFVGIGKLYGTLFGAGFAFALSLLTVKIKKTELRYLWSASIAVLGGALMGWLMYEIFSAMVHPTIPGVDSISGVDPSLKYDKPPKSEIVSQVRILISASSYIFFKILLVFGFPITGLFIGINKPNLFSPLNIKEFFRGSSAFTESYILDTSAIIDGRVV
ncbi:MAG: PIN/TRAM domain-containing protein, partial [bacterium]|nr:PIN/TRAM domain-containing protein [bacterium]